MLYTILCNGVFCRISLKILLDEGDVTSLRCNSTFSGSVFVVWFELPVKTSMRWAEAGDLLSILSPYWILSLELCLAVLIVPIMTSQYQMLCIVSWYSRNILLYVHGLSYVGLVPSSLAAIFEPNVMGLSNAGIYLEYAWVGVILIALWYVWL